MQTKKKKTKKIENKIDKLVKTKEIEKQKIFERNFRIQIMLN